MKNSVYFLLALFDCFLGFGYLGMRNYLWATLMFGAAFLLSLSIKKENE